MIKDNRRNADRYRGLHPGIDEALRLMAEGTVEGRKPGRHDIRGEELFLLIQEYETRSGGRLEVHDRYIDVQLMMEGVEDLAHADRAACQADGLFDTASDIGFLHGSGDRFTLRSGEFAVFFPEDAHAPGIAHGAASGRVRKAVFKIRCSVTP